MQWPLQAITEPPSPPEWDRTTRPLPKLDLASTGQKMYDQASSLEIPGFDAFAMTAIDPGMLALIWFLCLGNG